MPKAVLATTVGVSASKFYAELIPRMAESHDILVVTSPDENLRRLAQGRGVRVKGLSMTREVSVGADLLSLIKWILLLAKERPEIVFTATPKASLLGQVAAKVLGVKHRYYFLLGLRLEGAGGMRRKILWLMEKITCLCAERIICNSDSLAQQVSAANLGRKEKVFVTRPGSSHGVDPLFFAPRPRDVTLLDSLGLKLGVPTIGIVGRLTSDKGIGTVLEACAQLDQDEIPFQLLVVGPQDERDSKAWVRRIESSLNNVSIVDSVDDIRPYFALMDIHVLASVREGFPNVVLEAASMGIPSIATDATGCIDSVVNGVTGLIFQSGASVELGKKIRLLINNPRMRMDMGEAAREHAGAYSPEAVTESILSAVGL